MKLSPQSLILCLISGLLVALAFSSAYTHWIIWLGFIPYFYVLFQLPLHWKAYFKASFFFGMTFYIGLIHWLLELHPLTWLQGMSYSLSLLIVYGGVLFISLVVSFWIWLYGLILARLKPVGYQRFLYPILLWMIMEWIQGLGDVSLPWGRLAVSQYHNLPLLQIINITGSIFISGLILAINVSLALWLIDIARKKESDSMNFSALVKLPAFKYVVISGLLVLSVHLYGFSRLQSSPTETRNPFKVSIIQGNVSQAEKWSTYEEYWSSIRKIMDKYIELTYDNAIIEKPDLIVWPESAIPVPLKLANQMNNKWVEQELKDLAKMTKADLFTGIFDINSNKQVYNAAVLINQKGQLEGWYHKRQLVPFGEFMPYRDMISSVPILKKILDTLNPLKGDTAKGLTPGNIAHQVGQLGSLICFESVYPHVSRESVLAGAEVLLIITNDGWYRDAIAIHQHKAHAILRAIENNRYIVRSANTGVSAIIDNQGRVLKELPILETKTLSGMVQPISQLTFYTKYGEWVVYLSILSLVGLVLIGLFMNISRKQSGHKPS